jgi:large subunit ribosomal protein L32
MVKSAPALSLCPKCHEPKLPHRVCPNCGYYDGKEVVSEE